MPARKGNVVWRYMHWLHTRWPAGTIEKLPRVNPDGSTNVPGVYVVGDLTGVPLLKFSADTGARSVRTIAARRGNADRTDGDLDLLIIGAGISGMSAALEAEKDDLRFEILEAAEPFSTIVNFPKAKPIYTYPTGMTPAGELQFRPEIHPKEQLVDDLRAQTHAVQPRAARAQRIARKDGLLEVHLADGPPVHARNVIVAIGRSGNFRKLGVSGEDSGKVFNRLHDPKEFAGKDVLVVGGGDSALETVIAIAEAGGRVTLSYRKPEFSRPKPDNVEKLNKLMSDPMADVSIENPASERVTTASGDFMGAYRKPGSIRLMLASRVDAIRDDQVDLTDAQGQKLSISNDAVFSMIGREAPLDFFRRSGVVIQGDRGLRWWATLVAFFLFCVWVYNWKSQYVWPGNAFGVPFPKWLDPDPSGIAQRVQDPATILGTLTVSASSRSFYYTLAYTTVILIFGIRRIRRRRTPYVTIQTSCLMAIQFVPLFLLPEIVLPLLGHNGFFDGGARKWIADQLFPVVSYGHGREYWRAYGFILAWPLMIQNVFSDRPMFLWLLIAFVQTCVLIPLLIWRFGKGAYCGWICSCGAMAETLGDQHRAKMPHGPIWNRLNMVGQIVLALAVFLLLLRVVGWFGFGPAGRLFHFLKGEAPALNYSWLVDIFLAGAIGYGFYFHFSGRVWCRFACPLAALMHIYARFSRFRILADKKKCISCNVCTSVCHQG
ncbi:MAG: NAD(P)-binding domain-containing protein, partial [Tepidisphaeraceae bacterium]